MANMIDVVTWARIEPHAATTDVDVGLAAEIADPMWLLARQLQLGEFAGDDGGSPVSIDIAASYARLGRFRAGPLPVGGDGSAEAIDLDPAAPLETVVEAEPISAARAWAIRVDSGRRLEQDLAATGLAALQPSFRAAAPFKASSDSRIGVHEARYAAMFDGRVTDGIDVYSRAGADNWAELRALAADPAQFDAVMTTWRQWFESNWKIAASPAETSPSWRPERLDYAFSVASPGFEDGEIVLTATDYDGDGLDWTDVDLAPGATLGPRAEPVADQSNSMVRHVLPRSVSFPGMPADRFWEMEDGLIDLGSLDAGPTDLARMLAIEAAVISSPDWFVAPLELPVGALARIDWVIVRDTFGVATLVGTHATQADDDHAGRMFQLSTVQDPVADKPLLFIPPAVLYGQRSAPLEDLLLQRDEQANLVWAIEKSVLGAAGRPVTIQTSRPPPNRFAPDFHADLIYQVATPAPAGWTPFVPVYVETGPAPQQMLQRALMLDTPTASLRGGEGQVVRGVSRIYEEEVGRDGTRVQLVDQLARWIDGSTHVWRGRQKMAGTGESYANVHFDLTARRN